LPAPWPLADCPGTFGNTDIGSRAGNGLGSAQWRAPKIMSGYTFFVLAQGSAAVTTER
jgi:hypothetical protein